MNISQASFHCLDCHDFSEAVLFPESDECLHCHGLNECQNLMDESTKNIQIKMDCMSCHNSHTENKYEDCGECHKVSAGGLHDNLLHETCALCHLPHKSTDLREKCLLCHSDRESHYGETNCVICHSFVS
jgi:hypothetical protein